jgi:hypothetical protein
VTADPHHTEQGPGRPLSASLAASTPLVGASRRPDPGSGPQAGTEAVAPYRQLLAHLQAARAKALQSGPRCRLDEAGWVNDGIAIGHHAAIAWAITLFEGHEAREVYLAAEGETARTTPDNSAASSDTADNSLREQYAAAIGAVWDGWIDAWVDVDVSDPEGVLADVVLAVRDREMERLEKLHQAHLRVEARLAGGSLVAEAAVERIRLLIGAYRPRLRLADPILLGKLEQVVAQVGELESAEAGEQP